MDVGLPGQSLAAYESGYLGFAPQRELSGLGVDYVVTAISKVPRSAADLVQQPQRHGRDGQGGALDGVTPVWVPSPRWG